MNPFVAAPTPPSQALTNAQKWNGRKKNRVAPVIPQPVANVVPAQKADPAPPPNPSANEIIPPGHKWVLVPDNTPEPEPSKPSAELKAAQEAIDKLQRIVEAAVICLIEHRTEYPLTRFGITEAYLPKGRSKC